MTIETAAERTDPIGTLILITDERDGWTCQLCGEPVNRELFDRLRNRWTSLRYGTRNGPEVPARGRVVSARHVDPSAKPTPDVLVEEARPTTDLGLDLPLTLEGTDR